MTAALPSEIFPSDDDSLADEITLLAGHINAATYRFLKLIAEFDRRSGWCCGGTVRSCAHWLNWKCGIDMGAAREKVRVAHCLEELPLINAAFAGGEISYSKVRAMTRVATNENEDYLLNIARHGTAGHMELLVRKFQRVKRQCTQDNEAKQHAERELRYYQDDNGMWVISARLPAEDGELLIKAIEAIVQSDLEKESDTASRGQTEDIETETFPRKRFPDEEGLQLQAPQICIPQRRSDALARLAEHFVATGGRSGELGALKGADRCQVVLHMALDELKGTDSLPLHPTTLKRFSCDASVVAAIEDNAGNVLSIGRKSRTVPPAMRRALALRDETCRFPGCCESHYVDAQSLPRCIGYHVQHWAEGGETRLENLVTLCRFHHRALHSGAFSIDVATNKRKFSDFRFLDKRGAVLTCVEQPPSFGPDALQNLTDDVLATTIIDASTAVTQWAGESLDYAMAMDGLLQRERVANG